MSDWVQGNGCQRFSVVLWSIWAGKGHYVNIMDNSNGRVWNSSQNGEVCEVELQLFWNNFGATDNVEIPSFIFYLATHLIQRSCR